MYSTKQMIDTLQKNIETLTQYAEEHKDTEVIEEVINDIEYVIQELEEL